MHALFVWESGALAPASGRRPDILGGGPDQAVVGTLLKYVSRPTRGARQDENRREQRRRYSQQMKRGGAIEIQVGKQLLLLPHDLLDALGDRIEPYIGRLL